MKLICYPTHEGPPKIRPASTARAWMDATNERFVYRCLPLSIANAAGWEILNPVPFSAVWNGKPGRKAVKVRPDDEEKQPLGTSHFGAGVLTFSVGALFDTPPDLVLWVGGSPNHVKDGIQPLTGIVETGWSPYTFTMNWVFTRPRKRIRFEEDEPFCFLFPLSLDTIEDAEPTIRSLEDVPQLGANYTMWSRLRNTFIEALKVPGSEAQQLKWQKHYHRGIRPDGNPAPAKHRTRVRLQSFRSDEA